jgi:hypothetical protein
MVHAAKQFAGDSIREVEGGLQRVGDLSNTPRHDGRPVAGVSIFCEEATASCGALKPIPARMLTHGGSRSCDRDREGVGKAAPGP